MCLNLHKIILNIVRILTFVASGKGDWVAGVSIGRETSLHTL